MIENSLIYIADDQNDRLHLCISKTLKKKIFYIVHDKVSHAEFHWSYENIVSILYFQKLFRWLRCYIECCYECQLNQTNRHSTYDSLTSIVTLSISDHTIIMNFILTLSETLTDFNITLTAYHSQTDKQSEQMNQTVEIVLHYYLTSNQRRDWSEQLFIIRGTLNNLPSVSTDQSLNEILYDF